MIKLSGEQFYQVGMWPTGSIESLIIHRLQEDPTTHTYSSIDELAFEVLLRKNILKSTRAMGQSRARFESFERARCNPQFWHLSHAGGFILNLGVLPSDAIRDIYRNSALYAFDCSTAIMIIYYHTLLNSIDDQLFNHLFQNLYLYSWHTDSDFKIKTTHTDYFIPGDVVYFNNPEFDPRQSWARGQNGVVLEDGMFFGHGLRITTAGRIIHALNIRRRRGSVQPAYITNYVVRPAFKHLTKNLTLPRSSSTRKNQNTFIHHNESSISLDSYLSYLNNI